MGSEGVLLGITSADPETRRLAVLRIADEGGDRASDLLVRALGDEDWRVRKEAAQAARSIERRSEVVRAIVGALDDRDNVGLRNAAVEALVLIGREAVPSAVHALATLDADGRKLAVEVLGGVPDVEGTRALVGALGDPDANVRVTAAEALASARLAGDEARGLAVAGLKGALRGGRAELSLAALEALLELEAELSWVEIAPLLEQPLLRRAAIAAAARCRDDLALVALAQTVAASPEGIAREAAAALCDVALGDPPQEKACDVVRRAFRDRDAVAERLIGWLVTPDDRTRAAAVLLLGVVGRPADAGVIARIMDEPGLETRAEAALVLLGNAAALPLLQEAKSLPPSAGAAAISVVPELLRFGIPAEGLHRTLLREQLASDAAEVVAASIKALGTLGDATDLTRAEGLVGHPDARVASAARSALLALAARMPEEAQARAEAIAPDSTAAVAACVMLQGGAATSPLEPAAIAYLKRALSAGDPSARRAAVDALAGAGSDEAKDALSLALADEERAVQIAAIRALGVLGHAAPLVTLIESSTDVDILASAFRAVAEADPERAVTLAERALSSPNGPVASAAVEAVASLSGPKRDDVLLRALEHPDAEVVRVALSYLQPPLDARSIARLGLCLDHPSFEVRRATAELLGQDGGAASEELLKERHEREPDASVRGSILSALRTATHRGEGS